MLEYRLSTYEKLCRELSIPILAPKISAGSLYTRADWIPRRGYEPYQRAARRHHRGQEEDRKSVV
jgi:hypothetical protein